MRRVPAGEFKAKCLAILDEVNETGEPVLVTKRGKPVARVVVADEASSKDDSESIFGCLRGMVKDTSDLDTLGDPIIPPEEWDHLKDDWTPFPPE